MTTRTIHSLHLALALTSTLGMVGCEDRSTPADKSPPVPVNPSPSNPAPANPPKTPAAAMPDNTAQNERDRNANTQTPIDQGESETDRRITADIRKAIMAEKGMSVNAQNCKVITRNGAVILRGPVASQAEKDMIADRAKVVSGVASVVNELEVVPPK